MSDVLDTEQAGPAALRGGALRTGAYLLSIVLSIGAAPLLIRHLGVERFGQYTTVMALMNLVAGVTEGGLNTVALREHATLRGAARASAMRSLLGIRLVLSIGGVLVGVAFALVAGYDSPLVIGAIGAGTGVVFQALQMLVSTPLQGELRFGWLAALQLAGQVLTVVFIVALVIADGGLVPFLWIGAPVGLALLAATAWLVRGRMPFRPSWRWAEIWPLVRDTVPYTAAVALNVVYFRVTILVMSLRASSLETGYFATSFRVVEVLLGIPAMVMAAAWPILARAERADEARFAYAMRRMLELATIFGLWMAMCCVVGAQVAIDLLAGDAAQPSVDVLRIQGLTLIATALGVAAGYGLLAQRRHAALLWMNALGLIGSVTLTLVLVGPLGAQGAAIATLSAESIMALGVTAVLLRTRPELAGGLAAAPLLVAVAGAAVAAGLLLDLPALVGLAIANVVFLGGLVAVRRFPPEVWELVRR